jgi:hypothetical protein
MEVRRAESLEPDPSPFEVEITVADLKNLNCQVLFRWKLRGD